MNLKKRDSIIEEITDYISKNFSVSAEYIRLLSTVLLTIDTSLSPYKWAEAAADMIDGGGIGLEEGELLKNLSVFNRNFTRKTLYVDMDGVLAEFRYVNSEAELYEKGYFLNLKPMKNVISGITYFMEDHPEIEVYVLSAYLEGSRWALQEKSMWLNRHFPQLEEEHQLFVKCGEYKSSVPLDDEQAFLLDDHSPNLLDWENAGHFGIKLLNGINGKGKKWNGKLLDSALLPKDFSDKLYEMMR